MLKNIMKRLSESVKFFMDSMPDNIRTRQLCAVVCMLSIFVLYVCINVNSSEAKPVEESETQESVMISQDAIYVTETEDVDEKVSSESDADITVELNEIDKEPEIIEETRENTLYYVTDEGYDFYLDSVYQDYLWNKLKEYNHTEFYETCLAMMYHESKFELDIVSATHDHGLMQINAGNYKWLHDTLDIESLDDPYDNIDCGVYMLVSNYDKYGNIEQALVAYHQGSAGSATSTSYSRCILGHDLECLTLLEDSDA